MQKIILVLSRLGANIGTCALFLIMASSTLDVASRNLLGKSVPGIIESAEVILVIGVFLGLAYAQRLKSHVATSLIIEQFPKPVQRVLRAAGLVVIIGYIALATWVTGLRAWQSFESGEVRFGLIEIPQWPARAAIALGFGLLLLELLHDFWRALHNENDAPDQPVGGL